MRDCLPAGRGQHRPVRRFGPLPLLLLFAGAALCFGAAPATAPDKADFNAINELLGLPLFADDNLWDDAPAIVAARLHLPAEGKTAHFESYRAYPRQPVDVLGSPGFMLSLKAAEGRLTAFTVMFTNRGDFPAFAKLEPPTSPTKDEVRAFEQALKNDFQSIADRLTARLGQPRHEFALNGGNLEGARQALRWETNRCALLLAQEPQQMVSLKIVPDEKTIVTRRPNGDVILDQIPMVDQGPKGYCLPATFERCLRYFDIPADMYELAAVGGTSFGGGTSFKNIVTGLELVVQRQGRRLEHADSELSLTRLAPYLDSGRPVIWSLSSTAAFNALANAHSEAREKSTNWAAWKLTVATAAKTPLAEERDTGHACLIIGYNRATNEIAFTDSWGPKYAERWVPVASAAKISPDEFWVMSW
jgi:hypothetical protein